MIGIWNAAASSAPAASLMLVAQRGMDIFRHGTRLLRRLLGQADDGVDGVLHLAVAEHHGAEHDVFESSWASDSTIITASRVPATTRSSLEFDMSSIGGLSLYSPSI